MIFENINNLGNDLEYSEVIKEAINYLKDTDWSTKENGRYELKGQDMFLNLVEYETAAEEEKKSEVHRKYIDIQYLIFGRESVKVAVDTGENGIYKEYDEENDILFYEEVEDESELVMIPGSFAVFFPNIAHKPGCIYKEKNTVRKAIIKINIELINDEKSLELSRVF